MGLVDSLKSGKEVEKEVRELMKNSKPSATMAIACVGSRGPAGKIVPCCPKSLQVLLDAGLDPNVSDPDPHRGRTSILHLACWNDALSCVRVLLDAKADINIKE